MRDWTEQEVRALLQGPPDEAFEGALEALRIEDSLIQRAACEVLEALDVVDELHQALRQRPLLALPAVAGLRDKRYSSTLIELATDAAEVEVRAQALATLSLLDLPEVQQVFFDALEDPASTVRIHAVQGLAQMGTPEALSAIEDAYQNEEDDAVKVFMVDVLDDAGLL